MAKRKRNPSSDAGREGPRRRPRPLARPVAEAGAEADDTATPPVFASRVRSDTLLRPQLPELAALVAEDGRRLSHHRPGSPNAGPKVPSPQDVTMTSPSPPPSPSASPSPGPAAPATIATPGLSTFGALPPSASRPFAAPSSFINTSSSSSSAAFPAALSQRSLRRNPATDSENFSSPASPSTALYRSAYVESCDDSDSEYENHTPSTIDCPTSDPPTPPSFSTAAEAISYRMARMPAEYRPAPVPAIDHPDVTRRRTRAQMHAIIAAAREQRERGQSSDATARQSVLARTVSCSSEFQAACSTAAAAAAAAAHTLAALAPDGVAAAGDEVKSPLSDAVSTTKTSLSESLGELNLNISAEEETATEERAQLPKGTKRTRSHSSSSSVSHAAQDDSIVSTTSGSTRRRPRRPPPAKAARVDPADAEREAEREAVAAMIGGLKESTASTYAPATPAMSASGESSEGPPAKRKRNNPDTVDLNTGSDKGKGKDRGVDKSSKSASTNNQPQAKTKRSTDSDVKTEQKKKKTPTTTRSGSKRKRSESFVPSSSASDAVNLDADLDVEILSLAEEPEPIPDPTPQHQPQLPRRRIEASAGPMIPDSELLEQRERALLVWQDDEITGREQDPEDSADDGFGLDGVGFEPPPARRAELKRRMNAAIAEYTRREQSSQRALRRQRRAGASTAQGSSDGSKESEHSRGKNEDGSGSDSSGRRKRVRFNQMD